MIEINLLPAEFRKKEKKDKKDAKMPELPYLRIFIIFFLCLVAVEALLFAFLLYQNQRSKTFNAEAKKLAPDFDRIKKIKLDTLRADTMNEKLTALSDRPFYWTSILNAVSESVTEDVWLTSVETERKITLFELPKSQEKKPEPPKPTDKKPKRFKRVETPKGKRAEHLLVIRGSAPASGSGTASIGIFIQSLKDNPLLKSILTKAKLEAIDRVMVEGESEIFNFTVTCLLKYPWGEANDPV